MELKSHLQLHFETEEICNIGNTREQEISFRVIAPSSFKLKVLHCYFCRGIQMRGCHSCGGSKGSLMAGPRLGQGRDHRPERGGSVSCSQKDKEDQKQVAGPRPTGQASAECRKPQESNNSRRQQPHYPTVEEEAGR